MILATRVKLVLAENPANGLEGIKVSLYDRDIGDPDDLLGTDITDENGEILFSYDSSLFMDEDDLPDWKIESLPDLFIVVYSNKEEIVLSTRSEVVSDKLQRIITVPVSQALVDQYGLS